MSEDNLSRLATCLIVDDDGDCRDVLREMMEFYGLTCMTASNGSQAWKMVQLCPPDLLITDMDMPLMNGLDLLRMCRAANHHFFVIVMSGHASAVDQQQVSLADCCAVILDKPFDAQSLRECLMAADSHDHYRYCVHNSSISSLEHLQKQVG